MSKDLFLMMREQEVSTNNFLPTKKELQKSSIAFIESVLDSGEHDLKLLYAQAVRLKETINVIEKELKNELQDEDFEAFGVKGKYSLGGHTLDYTGDDIHSKLTAKLKAREELLKASDKSKDIIYDSEGVEIPKLKRKYRASSIKVTF